jgi:hypothetical protein
MMDLKEKTRQLEIDLCKSLFSLSPPRHRSRHYLYFLFDSLSFLFFCELI